MTRRMPCQDRRDNDELPRSGRSQVPNGKGWCDPQSDATVPARRLHRGTHCSEKPQQQLLDNLVQHGYNRVMLWDKVKRFSALLCHGHQHPQARATMKTHDSSCSIGSDTGRNTSLSEASVKIPTGRIGSRQHLAGGVSWGCPEGAQRPCGDHLHPIQIGFHGQPFF